MDFDFVVTNYLQRLEGWATVTRQVDSQAGAAFAMAELYAAAVVVPVCGRAFQKHGTRGIDPDGFLLQKARFRFEARTDICRATITGWMPMQHGKDVEVTASCAAVSVMEICSPGASFTLSLDVDAVAGSEHEMRIELSSSFQPSSMPGESLDNRRLGCILLAIEFS